MQQFIVKMSWKLKWLVTAKAYIFYVSFLAKFHVEVTIFDTWCSIIVNTVRMGVNVILIMFQYSYIDCTKSKDQSDF